MFYISSIYIKNKIKQKIDAQFSTTKVWSACDPSRTIVFIVLLKFPVMIWSLYHKLLCGNLFLFPIVFFSISKKAYSFNSGIPDSFSSLSSQSHDTADNELILTARLIYKTIACENIHFSSLFTAGDVSRNVPSGEERGETDVFAG